MMKKNRVKKESEKNVRVMLMSISKAAIYFFFAA